MLTDIGFSGSREEPTNEQKKWLLQFTLDEVKAGRVTRAHHGCCIGSDAFFHKVCKEVMDLGLDEIVMHPPNLKDRMMKIEDWDMTNCLWYPSKPYLTRNKDIVSHVSRLVALPRKPERVRHSGTWHTVHQADRAGKPIYICYPTGRVEVRNK